jgi:hypothetical protein
MATNTFGIYDIGIGVAATPTMLGGITRQDVNTEPEFRAEVAGGAIYPRNLALVGQKPAGGFSTLNIAAALAALVPAGYAIDSGAEPETSLLFYMQKLAATGRASGAVHKRVQVHLGVIVPTRLTVSDEADAVLDYAFWAWFDGTNNPVVKTGTVTLPAAATDTERFTLGPVTIAADTLTSVKTLTLDFGVDVRLVKADADIWATDGYIATRAPRLTMDGVDPDWMYDAANDKIKIDGNAATHANTYFYLQKYDEDGVSVLADNVAEHVKISLAGIAGISKPMSVAGQDPAESAVVVAGHWDGTNDPVTVATATAIT